MGASKPKVERGRSSMASAATATLFRIISRRLRLRVVFMGVSLKEKSDRGKCKIVALRNLGRLGRGGPLSSFGAKAKVEQVLLRKDATSIRGGVEARAKVLN